MEYKMILLTARQAVIEALEEGIYEIEEYGLYLNDEVIM